jgi:hypothetical protein
MDDITESPPFESYRYLSVSGGFSAAYSRADRQTVQIVSHCKTSYHIMENKKFLLIESIPSAKHRIGPEIAIGGVCYGGNPIRPEDYP